MIYFLNRGPILELEILKAFRFYLERKGITEYYKNNFRVSLTNEHPFGQMLLSKASGSKATSRLPVIVVATESDRKPADLNILGMGNTHDLIVTPADIELYEKRYKMMPPRIINELRGAMDSRKIKKLFGVQRFSWRQDIISVDIWAENPQVKNDLYDCIRDYICTFLEDYLEGLYREIFPELEGSDEAPIDIFDNSVFGQRSNNSNLDFGIELFGAYLAFEVNYVIELSIIDTDIEEENENLLLEVINHVKGYGETVREWIIGPLHGGEGSTGEPAAGGEQATG